MATKTKADLAVYQLLRLVKHVGARQIQDLAGVGAGTLRRWQREENFPKPNSNTEKVRQGNPLFALWEPIRRPSPVWSGKQVARWLKATGRVGGR